MSSINNCFNAYNFLFKSGFEIDDDLDGLPASTNQPDPSQDPLYAELHHDQLPSGFESTASKIDALDKQAFSASELFPSDARTDHPISPRSQIQTKKFKGN